MSAAAAGGRYTSRKFVTEELLVKLNALLEQLARQQPPIDPTVDAYKRENDKVQYYLNELQKKPDDPYLRAQLHQAMDDKQQLYNLYEGNKNPFKTETNNTSETQPQKQSTGSKADREMEMEMEKLRELFESYKERGYSETPEKESKNQRKGYQVIYMLHPLPLIILGRLRNQEKQNKIQGYQVI